MIDKDEVKQRFLNDTKNHTMEVLMDNGLYRHLKFTNNGSQCYRYDIHTWPGYLTISGDMGTYVFSRITDMFEFFGEDRINPGYWAEKLQAVNSSSVMMDGNGYSEFSSDAFTENVTNEYNNFAEEYLDADREGVAEAFPDDGQTYKQMLADLWESIEEEVLSKAGDGPTRAYDAAMDFRWTSDNDELEFDMQDFWDYNCTEYTFHYIWILNAIVHSIGDYRRMHDERKDKEAM